MKMLVSKIVRYIRYDYMPFSHKRTTCAAQCSRPPEMWPGASSGPLTQHHIGETVLMPCCLLLPKASGTILLYGGMHREVLHKQKIAPSHGGIIWSHTPTREDAASNQDARMASTPADSPWIHQLDTVTGRQKGGGRFHDFVPSPFLYMNIVIIDTYIWIIYLFYLFNMYSENDFCFLARSPNHTHTHHKTTQKHWHAYKLFFY